MTPVNDDPTISAVGDLTITVNADTGPLAFAVGDVESGGAVTVTASSSNQTLVPDANILVSGSGISRTVAVTPAAAQSGVVTITLTVSDGNGGMVQEGFVLTVLVNKLFLPRLSR